MSLYDLVFEALCLPCLLRLRKCCSSRVVFVITIPSHHSFSIISRIVTEMIANELYQFSTGDALIADVASHGVSITDFLSRIRRQRT